MLIQFRGEISRGEVMLPPHFASTHWTKVSKSRDSVNILFPMGVISEIGYRVVNRNYRDTRLTFSNDTLQTLNLREGDGIIFQYDNAESPINLGVYSILNESKISMANTRIGRAYNLYIHQIPAEYKDFVEDIIDVPPDGSCGYHCVVQEIYGIDGLPESASQLRKLVYDELTGNYELYRAAMGLQAEADKQSFDTYITNVKHGWMDITLSGVIATAIKIPILMLALTGCCVYVPQRSGPELSPGSVICMAYVNGNHYVRVL